MSSIPIFIIGTERSGSNLLRLILNAHPEITVPHPPHIVAFFAPLEKSYGNLSIEQNFRKLANDVVLHVERHIHPWTVPLNKEALIKSASPRDSFGLSTAIYDQHLAAMGKRRWGCKSTFMIHYTDRVFARYPDAQLLWLVRDPRDVAVSSRDSVFNPYHPYYTALLWAAQQELGLRLEGQLNQTNVLRVYYEKLVTDPHTTVAGICEFLNVPFVPSMLRFFESEEARTSAGQARDWQNVAQPIISSNTNKYRGRLSEFDIAAVESVAGSVMQKLDYEPVSAPRTSDTRLLRHVRYRIENELLRLRVEYRSLREDRNHWRRWRRRARMLLLNARLGLGLR